MKGPGRRRRLAWCSWHGGYDHTARLVQITPDLYACGPCRTRRQLAVIPEQP